MGDYVSIKNLTKSFGSVVANHDITMGFAKGEIHALLGENGCGKSTLMNMLSGIYSPDSGQIFIGDKACAFSSPKDAIASGIGMVHQHFKLVDVMSAKENIVAGSKNGFVLKGKQLSSKIAQLADKFGLLIDPDKKVYDMSVGEKQTVEIMKMLYRGADVLILDEPTAVLTPQETKILFKILKNMKKQDCAVIIITHKLNEVMAISDRVSVLRKGEFVGTVDTDKVNPKMLTEMMVGCPIELKIDHPICEKSKEPILEVKKLCAKNEFGFSTLKNMSFDIYGGEILGVAGIAGSGQKEMCEIIAGLDSATKGSVRFKQEEILGLSPIAILQKGVSMSFVPEDRLGMGLVGNMDITGNILLRCFQKNSGPFIDFKGGRTKAEKIVKRYNISTPSVKHKLKKLSGGNIQKVLLGREVDLNPTLLITAYPVRGLDIGASYNIYDILNQQKQKGVAVLFVGEDLDVLMAMCDRIMVIHDGECMGIVEPANISKEDIGLMMLGHNETGKGDN